MNETSCKQLQHNALVFSENQTKRAGKTHFDEQSAPSKRKHYTTGRTRGHIPSVYR